MDQKIKGHFILGIGYHGLIIKMNLLYNNQNTTQKSRKSWELSSSKSEKNGQQIILMVDGVLKRKIFEQKVTAEMFGAYQLSLKQILIFIISFFQLVFFLLFLEGIVPKIAPDTAPIKVIKIALHAANDIITPPNNKLLFLSLLNRNDNCDNY